MVSTTYILHSRFEIVILVAYIICNLIMQLVIRMRVWMQLFKNVFQIWKMAFSVTA